MSRHQTRELADSWIQGVACSSKPQIIFVFAMVEDDPYYLLIGDCKSDRKMVMARVAWIAGVHARSDQSSSGTFSGPYMRTCAYMNGVHETASGAGSRSRIPCHIRQRKHGNMSQRTGFANQEMRNPVRLDYGGLEVI
jgi:hypothetical protein